MLAEWFAKNASGTQVTVRLTLQGTEISTPGYVAQVTKLSSDGKVASASVEFVFTDRALFDTVEWSAGNTILRKVAVAYDGPRGSHQATLELEVDE